MLVSCKKCGRSIEIPKDFRKIAICSICGIGMTPNYCIEAVKKQYIKDMKEFGSKKETIEKKIAEIDWDQILDNFVNKIYPLTRIETNPKGKKTLEFFEKVLPEFYQYTIGRTYIFGSEYYIPNPCCPMFTNNGVRKAIIIIPEYFFPLPIKGIFYELLHETMHIDLEINPGRYELEKYDPCCENYYKDKAIEKVVDKLGFKDKWKKKRFKLNRKGFKKAKIINFNYGAVLYIFTCLKGKEY